MDGLLALSQLQTLKLKAVRSICIGAGRLAEHGSLQELYLLGCLFYVDCLAPVLALPQLVAFGCTGLRSRNNEIPPEPINVGPTFLQQGVCLALLVS